MCRTLEYILCVLVKYASLEKLRALEYMHALCVFERVGDIETNINLTCNILPISHDPMNVYIVVPSYQARHLS